MRVDLVQLAAQDADQAFEQHIDAVDLGGALAEQAGIGEERHGIGALVHDVLLHGEEIVLIDRDGAGEGEAFAIVPGEDERLAGRQSGVGRGLPFGIEVGQLHRGAGGGDEAVLGEIAMRGAERVEERDFRALRVDRLAVVLEADVVEAGAGEIDGAVDDRGFDRDALGRSDGGLTRDDGCRLGARNDGARLLLAARHLGLLLSLLLELLLRRRRIKILPAEDDRHGEDDGENEILIIMLHGQSRSPVGGVQPFQGCPNVILKA
jgi:hypothetical protein